MRKWSIDLLESLEVKLPDEIERYRAAGDYEAEREAILRWQKRPVSQVLQDRLYLETMFLDRYRLQFPFPESEVISLFQEYVSDFSHEDLLRLDQEGLAEWIFINNEKYYIHNIVRNVLRKDEDILKRAGRKDEDAGEREQLKKELAYMKTQGKSIWKIRIRSSIRLCDEEFYPGIRLTAHLPIPVRQHQIKQVKILSIDSSAVGVDSDDSNYASVCFREVLEENKEFYVEYEYRIEADYQNVYQDTQRDIHPDRYRDDQSDTLSDLCLEDGRSDDLTGLQEYLREESPHIRFTKDLRELAKEIVGKETDSLERARRIYDYITKNVKYSYMKTYFLLEDIPQYCARNLRGDCGVQALLFITLCRICGIPAKWQSGLYAAPYYIGPHDWAMFYVEPYGWLWADPSFGGAAQDDGDEERRQFYFGNLDPFRMVANHAFKQEFSIPKLFIPDDPYDNQVGELESDEKGYCGNQRISDYKVVDIRRV